MIKNRGFALLASTILCSQAVAESKIELSGLIEFEAGYHKPYAGDATGNFVVAGTEIAFSSQINDQISAEVILYHDDETPIEVDASTLTLASKEGGRYLTMGLQYLPFGLYETNLVSDPITLDLAETRKTALKVALKNQNTEITFYTYNGANSDGLNTGVNIKYESGDSENSRLFSLGYIDNLAETDRLAESVMPDKKVAALALSGIWSQGAINLTGEFVGSASAFSASDLSYKSSGAQPKSWNLEVAYDLVIAGQESNIALGYQASSEAVALELPKTRLLAGLSTAIIEDATLGLEIAVDRDYSTQDGGTGKKATTVTAQIAVEF